MTDLADAGVVLALVPVVAVVTFSGGWRRGARAWVLAVCGTLAVMLVLKLGLSTGLRAGWIQGGGGVHSPSGHTASAVLIAGGVALLFGMHRAGWLAVAFAAGLLIGVSRVALMYHTLAECVLGGLVGLVGLLAMARLAGPAPGRHARWVLVLGVVATIGGLHGTNLGVERAIQQAARELAQDFQ